MARKGNRNRNGLDRNTPTHKHAVSGSTDASFSENKKENSEVCNKNITDADMSTADPQCRSISPSEGRVNDTKCMPSGKKSKQRPNSVHGREKSENGTFNKVESVDTCGQGRDTVGTDIVSDFSESRIDGTASCGSSNNSRNTTRYTEDVFLEDMNDCRPSEILSIQHLRVFFMHLLERAKEWIQQQKPRFKAFTTAMSYAHSYICVKVEYAYPIIWTWVSYFGKLMFVLSIVLLDCNIRGFNSLLHLGTTSFLTVLWCGILSVTAMIGITKMLIIMVIAALLVSFTAFAFAIVTATVIATVILWLYGSFWTTGFVIFLGGVALTLRHDRVAVFVMTLYCMHSARSYVGWLGLVLGLNLAFVSTDALLYILKNKTNEYRSNIHPEHASESQGGAGPFSSEHLHSYSTEDTFHSGYGRSADRGQGIPSTSGSEAELTSDNEVIRLLNSHDHYSALGLNRYENIDVSSLKKEYRKKAMLVHPDKNMGNDKAAEAFKKLQNAYEVLLDSLKRKTYDDELRREELLDYFRKFQSASQKNGRHSIFNSGSSKFEAGDEGSSGESRRITCKKCGDCHIWRRTQRSKSRARWCQDCQDFHQAKDGDGWAEQSFQPLLFGLLQKMDPLCVYVCAESRIYDATEWFLCQGMRCPPNTHKASFHVNASVISKHSNGKGTGSSARGSGGMPTADMDETMTEEEFFEWLQSAVQSGMFEPSSVPNESPAARTGNGSRSGTKKRKGKKQW